MRFMLWIDGVGGYLVCERPGVVVGQPIALGRSRRGSDEQEHEVVQAPVDIPLMADVSRRHALIERHGEHHWLRPLRATFVDGAPIERPHRLGHDAVLEFGDRAGRGVRMAWRVPNVCGLTATLQLQSRHRMQPHADGVVLLADSCLIGPAVDDHVRAASWRRSVVLHRRPDGELVFRADGPYDVDGRAASGVTPVSRSARVRADDFSFRLEPLDS